MWEVEEENPEKEPTASGLAQKESTAKDPENLGSGIAENPENLGSGIAVSGIAEDANLL